jgi:hypothetical protein
MHVEKKAWDIAEHYLKRVVGTFDPVIAYALRTYITNARGTGVSNAFCVDAMGWSSKDGKHRSHYAPHTSAAIFLNSGKTSPRAAAPASRRPSAKYKSR